MSKAISNEASKSHRSMYIQNVYQICFAKDQLHGSARCRQSDTTAELQQNPMSEQIHHVDRYNVTGTLGDYIEDGQLEYKHK